MPVPTSTYHYKLHCWICSLLLTIEIFNNLCQIPSAKLDIAPALGHPLPPLLQLMSASDPIRMCWSIGGWWCEGWAKPFVSVFKRSFCLYTVYMKAWWPLLPSWASAPLKERERENTQTTSFSPPPHLLVWTLHNSSLLSSCMKHHRLFLQDR